jgi:hypothetical protein
MPSITERIPAILSLAFAAFIIFMWVFSLSASPVIAQQGIFYYVGCGLVAAFLTGYAIVAGALQIAQLAKE